MSKKTKNKTRRRPLMISIHGEDIQVEAKFSDSHLSALLADMIKRVNRPPAVQATILTELLSEFGKSLRKDQLDALMNTLDMAQKVMFMEIMNNTRQEHTS